MKWLELTSTELREAAVLCNGVCVLPLGCIEKHGDHLPLGTDCFEAEGLVARAAALELVVEFPVLPFTQIQEAKHYPGAIATGARLLWDLLENICREIARNGFTKIIVVNGHGGNNHFLAYFAQMRLEQPEAYTLYLYHGGQPSSAVGSEWNTMRAGQEDGHAGEEETSLMLALRPDLVKLGKIAAPGTARGRHRHLGEVKTGHDWYADYPTHYAGNGLDGTAEKGEFLLTYYAQQLAEAFRVVKSDEVAPTLLQDFFQASRHTPGKS